MTHWCQTAQVENTFSENDFLQQRHHNPIYYILKCIKWLDYPNPTVFKNTQTTNSCFHFSLMLKFILCLFIAVNSISVSDKQQIQRCARTPSCARLMLQHQKSRRRWGNVFWWKINHLIKFSIKELYESNFFKKIEQRLIYLWEKNIMNRIYS